MYNIMEYNGENLSLYDTNNENFTDSPPFEFSDYKQRIIVATLFLIASIVGTLGNMLVIMAVLLSKKLRTATNVFVVNLSVADLVTSLVIPWNTVALLGRDELPVDAVVCSVVSVVLYTTVGCSMYMLASIGLNRLLLITRPTTTYRTIYTPTKIAVWLVLTWLIPLSITLLPPLFDVGAVGYNAKYHTCGSISTHPRSNTYDLLVAGALYPTPLIIIVVCYLLIWRYLDQHAKKMVSSPEASVESTANNLSVISRPALPSMINSYNHNNHLRNLPNRSGTVSRTRMTHRQYEITRNMFYIVCGFFLCLTPFAFCLFFDDSDPAIPYTAAILFINSCINPFIYATKHPHFKTVFRCIMKRQWDHIPEPSDTLKALRRGKLCGKSGFYV